MAGQPFCSYCFHPLSQAQSDQMGQPPAASDNAAWAIIASQHYAANAASGYDGCDWVLTRAHRIAPRGPHERAADYAARVRRQSGQ